MRIKLNFPQAFILPVDMLIAWQLLAVILFPFAFIERISSAGRSTVTPKQHLTTNKLEGNI